MVEKQWGHSLVEGGGGVSTSLRFIRLIFLIRMKIAKATIRKLMRNNPRK